VVKSILNRMTGVDMNILRAEWRLYAAKYALSTGKVKPSDTLNYLA
jgi:hypothetical protein